MTAFPIVQDLPAILTGVAAAVCLTASPMFQTWRTILLAQLAATLFFTAHYFCLGITVAAVVDLLAAVQIGAALFSARSAAMGRLGYALICLMALVGFWFWQGPISALSVVATVLIALGRMQSDELRLRVLLISGGVFWVMHDFAAQAWIAFVADVGALLSGAMALFLLLVRVTIEWRPSVGARTAPAT